MSSLLTPRGWRRFDSLSHHHYPISSLLLLWNKTTHVLLPVIFTHREIKIWVPILYTLGFHVFWRCVFRLWSSGMWRRVLSYLHFLCIVYIFLPLLLNMLILYNYNMCSLLSSTLKSEAESVCPPMRLHDHDHNSGDRNWIFFHFFCHVIYWFLIFL
jgi:hypothetical protein